MQTDLFSMNTPLERDNLRLSEFMDFIKTAFDDFIWFKSHTVEVEVKSIKKVRQFHYLELVETDSSSRIISSCRGTIFNPLVVDSFLKRAKLSSFDEIIGSKILINAWPNFHKDYWFSVNIDKIFSENTVWNLQIKKEELIKTLKEKWLFYLNKEQVIGDVPMKLALVSAETSEWLRDFLSILDESKINFNYDLYEAKVGWADASKSVLGALTEIQDSIYDYDAAVVLRWGWASEGMNWTNDSDLCHFASELDFPLLTAIGHTVDEWVLDMIAYKNLKTPSEAAKFIIDIYSEKLNNLSLLKREIDLKISDKIYYYSSELSRISLLIKNSSLKVEGYKKELENLISKIRSHSPEKALSKGYSYVKDNSWNVLSNFEVWDSVILVSAFWEFEIEIKKKIS